MNNAIEIKSLVKDFGIVRAVDNVSFTVREGELFSLLGINGAGKTTLLRMLMGLCTPTDGDAIVMGHSVLTELNDVKQVSGISPQVSAVAPHLTVRENLVWMAGVYGCNGEEAKKRATSLMKQFLLTDVANRRAKVLSGGYQRRLSIAMAMAGEPKVLYLDEPTLGLDVIARRELWRLVESLHGHVTVILTTHYMEEAEALSDRIGIMANGHLLAVDAPENIKLKTGKDSIEDAFIAVVERGGLISDSTPNEEGGDQV